MDFLWEDSVGARAVMMLRGMEQGAILFTPDFAERLSVKPGALHQLLANAVKLRYIKKVYGRGPCVGWTLGAGGDSATIERRKTPATLSEAELARRRAANQRRRQRAGAARAPAPSAPPAVGWPPGFVSSWPGTDTYQLPRIAIDEPDEGAVDSSEPLPVWLRGLVASPAPEPIEEPPEPQPQQLPLFDPSEIGPGGRARWRRLDLTLPMPRRAGAPGWRQTTFLELERA